MKPRILTDDQVREKFSDIPQDGLFEMADKRSEEPQNKVAKPKVVGHTECPECGKEKVGVIRVLDDEFRPHLVLKAHDRVTRSGHRFPCKGTGTEVDR